MLFREDLMWGTDHRTGSACTLSLALGRFESQLTDVGRYPGLTSSELEEVQSGLFNERASMNTTQHNKKLVESIFAALAEGNRQPFAEAMADEFSWTISGHGPWARTWSGKDVVRRELMLPLFAQFADTYRNRALRIVAEGDTVVVECRGTVLTRQGERYDNHYTYWIELREGSMVSLTEYMDTALAERVLVAPEHD
jgi:uncharacterized protein